MKIFVSYSFRSENDWVEEYVIPLIECFGHEAVTGRILDAGPLDEEVKKKIRSCRRVLCFVTRARPRYTAGGTVDAYEPPDWVRDEIMLARGANLDVIEFREKEVAFGGATGYHAYVEFDRTEVSKLLVDLARRLKDWPVGPLLLRLDVPDRLRTEMQNAVNAGTLEARCSITDDNGDVSHDERLPVRMRDDRLIVPFWVKPAPQQTIEIEIALGAQRLVSKGIIPAVREARLSVA